MDKEDKIIEILLDFEEKDISIQDAQKQILFLFDVVVPKGTLCEHKWIKTGNRSEVSRDKCYHCGKFKN
jgi:hypothetical protein